MTIHSFVVVGEQSTPITPDAFQDYLFSRIRGGKHLSLKAREAFDESSALQSFEFKVREVYLSPLFLNVEDAETGEWIEVRTNGDAVYFEIEESHHEQHTQ